MVITFADQESERHHTKKRSRRHALFESTANRPLAEVHLQTPHILPAKRRELHARHSEFPYAPPDRCIPLYRLALCQKAIEKIRIPADENVVQRRTGKILHRIMTARAIALIEVAALLHTLLTLRQARTFEVIRFGDWPTELIAG
jgi:hypothetical protein